MTAHPSTKGPQGLAWAPKCGYPGVAIRPSVCGAPIVCYQTNVRVRHTNTTRGVLCTALLSIHVILTSYPALYSIHVILTSSSLARRRLASRRQSPKYRRRLPEVTTRKLMPFAQFSTNLQARWTHIGSDPSPASYSSVKAHGH